MVVVVVRDAAPEVISASKVLPMLGPWLVPADVVFATVVRGITRETLVVVLVVGVPMVVDDVAIGVLVGAVPADVVVVMSVDVVFAIATERLAVVVVLLVVGATEALALELVVATMLVAVSIVVAIGVVVEVAVTEGFTFVPCAVDIAALVVVVLAKF